MKCSDFLKFLILIYLKKSLRTLTFKEQYATEGVKRVF